MQRAVRTEKDLVQQLAVHKAQQVNSSASFIELRELQRKANATRTIYESFLKRASETGQEEKLTSKNIRVISQAEPPLQARGPSRKLIAIGGMIAGFMAGVGLGIALGAYRSLKDLLRRSSRPAGADPRRDPSGQDDHHPDAPGMSGYIRRARACGTPGVDAVGASCGCAAAAALSAVPARRDVASLRMLAMMRS